MTSPMPSLASTVIARSPVRPGAEMLNVTGNGLPFSMKVSVRMVPALASATRSEAAGVLLVLLGLEVVDQLLDLRAVGRVGRRGEVLLVAEDRRVVVAEVAVALADVEQEVRDRPGLVRLLVLVERLAELGERVEL